MERILQNSTQNFFKWPIKLALKSIVKLTKPKQTPNKHQNIVTYVFFSISLFTSHSDPFSLSFCNEYYATNSLHTFVRVHCQKQAYIF